MRILTVTNVSLFRYISPMDCLKAASCIGTLQKIVRPVHLRVTWSFYQRIVVAQKILSRSYYDSPVPLRSTKSKSIRDVRIFSIMFVFN